jgi:hypothetical protein
MNHDEHPRFLMGEAILRCLGQAPLRPHTWPHLDGVRELLRTHLTDDELHYVITHTGWDICGEFDVTGERDQLELPLCSGPRAAREVETATDDEIPF